MINLSFHSCLLVHSWTSLISRNLRSPSVVLEVLAPERACEAFAVGKKSVREINSWISFKRVQFAFLTPTVCKETRSLRAARGRAYARSFRGRRRRWLSRRSRRIITDNAASAVDLCDSSASIVEARVCQIDRV